VQVLLQKLQFLAAFVQNIGGGRTADIAKRYYFYASKSTSALVEDKQALLTKKR